MNPTITIRLKFTFVDESLQGNSKSEFWESHQKWIAKQLARFGSDPNKVLFETTADEMEQRVRQAFGSRLKELIIQRVVQSNSSVKSLATEFVIRNVNYASLGVELGIVNVKSLVEFVDSNFELLKVILEQYSAYALYDSIQPLIDMERGNFIARSVVRTGPPLKASLENLGDLQKVFELPIAIDSNTGTASKMEKLRWFWQAANSSLLLPAILAIYICLKLWDVFVEIEKKRQENNSALIESYKKLNEETFKLLEKKLTK